MFSTGQLVFTAFFVIVFSFIIYMAYKKDASLHRKNYKGVKWVGIVFVIFLIILFALKYFLKF